MLIKVKTLGGEDHEFQVSEETSLSEFRQSLFEKTPSISIDRQRLIFRGHILEDDSKKMSELGLADGNVLHLAGRPPPVSDADGSQEPVSPSIFTHPDDVRAPRHFHTAEQVNLIVGNVPVLLHTNLGSERIETLVRRALDRVGDVGIRSTIETRDSSDGNSLEMRIRMRSTPNQTMDSPAMSRIQHALCVIRSTNHLLYHLEQDYQNLSETKEQACEGGTTPTPDEQTSPSGDANNQDQDSIDDFASILGGCTNEEHETGFNGRPAPALLPEGPSAEARRAAETLAGLIVRHGETSDLVGLMDEIEALQNRLEPLRATYKNIIKDDPSFEDTSQSARNVARFFNGFQLVLHNLAHVYHIWSDLNIHFCQAPPRLLYPQMIHAGPSQVHGGVQQEAEISLSFVNSNANNQPRSTTSTTSTAPPPSNTTQTQGIRMPLPTTGPILQGQVPFVLPIPRPGAPSGPTNTTTTNTTQPSNIFGGNFGQILSDSLRAAMESAANPAPVGSTVAVTTTTTGTSTATSQAAPQGFGTMMGNLMQQFMQGLQTGLSSAASSGPTTAPTETNRGPVASTGDPASQQQRVSSNATQRPPQPRRSSVPPSTRRGPSRRRNPAGRGGRGGRGPRIPGNVMARLTGHQLSGRQLYADELDGETFFGSTFVGPRPPPELPLFTMDPYLPCPSRHFNPRYNRHRLTTRGQQREGSTTTNQNQQPPQSQSSGVQQEPQPSRQESTNENEERFINSLMEMFQSVVENMNEADPANTYRIDTSRMQLQRLYAFRPQQFFGPSPQMMPPPQLTGPISVTVDLQRADGEPPYQPSPSGTRTGQEGPESSGGMGIQVSNEISNQISDQISNQISEAISREIEEQIDRQIDGASNLPRQRSQSDSNAVEVEPALLDYQPTNLEDGEVQQQNRWSVSDHPADESQESGGSSSAGIDASFLDDMPPIPPAIGAMMRSLQTSSPQTISETLDNGAGSTSGFNHMPGLVGVLFRCLVDNFSFTDVMLFREGDTTPLERQRMRIRRHLSDHITDGNVRLSDEDIESISNRIGLTGQLIQQWLPVDASFGRDSAGRTVDITRSLVNCEVSTIRTLLRIAFAIRDQQQMPFAESVAHRLSIYMRQMIYLINMGTGSSDGYELVMDKIFATITPGARESGGEQGFSRIWSEISPQAFQEFRDYLATFDKLTEADVRSCFIYADEEQEQVSGDEATNGGAISARSSDSKEDDDMEWKEILPKEWVEVVEEDIKIQRTQPKQEPFSELYMAGMPAKRRKPSNADENDMEPAAKEAREDFDNLD